MPLLSYRVAVFLQFWGSFFSIAMFFFQARVFGHIPAFFRPSAHHLLAESRAAGLAARICPPRPCSGHPGAGPVPCDTASFELSGVPAGGEKSEEGREPHSVLTS